MGKLLKQLEEETGKQLQLLEKHVVKRRHKNIPKNQERDASAASAVIPRWSYIC